MTRPLGSTVKKAREKKGWTLRETERATGIHNAHLSQIETGTIAKPNQPMLWTLAKALDLDYESLLDLAGHTTGRTDAKGQRQLAGALLRGLEDLSDEEQRELLLLMEELRRKKRQ